MTPDWQPTLCGSLLKLRPLVAGNFEALYAAASDPLIWEQHPDRERYRREVFERFFAGAMESRGAFIAIDLGSGAVVGGSRFTGYLPAERQIEIGYTFLARECWGRGHNTEMKRLMIEHAFRFVERVRFYVGERNFRSRRAVEKLGAVVDERVRREPVGAEAYWAIGYGLGKAEWAGGGGR